MNKTLFDFFEKHIGTESYLFEIEGGRKRTFDEVHSRACMFANAFGRYEQTVISVILPNSIDYVACYLGSILTNNIFNPIPYFISIQELKGVISYVEPSVIVTDKKKIIDLFKQEYKTIYPDNLSNKEIFYPRDIDKNSIAALYYSSGTTGDPKGVLYSHENMVSLISSIVRGFHFDKEDNQLALLPFGHTASINYNILPSLMTGSNLFISQGFELLRHEFFNVIERYGITYTEIVPTILLMLLKLKVDVSKMNFDKLKFIGCGSSNLPLSSQIKFIENYGIQVANLYGLSETGPTHIDNPLNNDWQPGSIGKPLDVNECKVNKDGEILIRGNNVFVGYYKNQSLFKKVVKDGWFYTGDLAYKKDDLFYYLDRKKDLIIKGGINIVPMEIEDILYKHDGVHECVVVGKDNDLYGEDLVAVVVIKEGLENNNVTMELKKLCKEYLSAYKIPSKIYFWDSLPRTVSHKLLRRVVREKVNII